MTRLRQARQARARLRDRHTHTHTHTHTTHTHTDTQSQTQTQTQTEERDRERRKREREGEKYLVYKLILTYILTFIYFYTQVSTNALELTVPHMSGVDRAMRAYLASGRRP